jgi:hypothetical protein
MFEPDNGKPINENKKTEVKVYTTMMRFTFRPYDEPDKIQRNNES